MQIGKIRGIFQKPDTMMEDASGADRNTNRLRRRLVSGVIGFFLAACIVCVLVDSTRQTSVVLEDDDEPDDEVGRAGTMKMSDMLKQAMADMDKLQKFQDDQATVNEELEDTLSDLQNNFTDAMDAARTASEQMEGSLRQVNEEAVASALRKVNASINEHIASTMNRLSNFRKESRWEIGNMSESFFNRFDQVRKRIVASRSFTSSAQDAVEARTRALELAIGGYEVLGAQKLSTLAARIEDLRGQLRAATTKAEAQLNQTDIEIMSRMAWGIGQARTAAEGEVAQTRSELQADFDQGMQQLQSSIDGLQSRAQADIDDMKKSLTNVQSQHADQTKVIAACMACFDLRPNLIISHDACEHRVAAYFLC